MNAPKKIVLGITGGVAAYKAAELARLFVKAGIAVQVVMTQAAARFITTETMQALTGRAVLTDLWDESIPNRMAHIELTRDADAIVIAPASADFIAKLANGLADDLLSTLCVARPAKLPLFVAPAMNREMWENAATQRNVARIAHDGITLIGPDSGEQACGEVGLGRMDEPEHIFAAVQTQFSAKTKLLAGKHVLLTAGPTFEAIDAVRGLTNRSSGKMGYALAQAAHDAGANVTLISGPTSLATPTGVTLVNVESAAEMFEAVKQHVSKAGIFIGVAAVADYRVEQPSTQKMKKSDKALELKLVPNPDIVAWVASLPNAPFTVGFAAESENVIEHAQEKRRKKNLPLIIANSASAAGADDNELVLIDDNGTHTLPRTSKMQLARQVIAHIANLLMPAQKPALRSVATTRK